MTSENAPNPTGSSVGSRLQHPAWDAVSEFLKAQSGVPPRSRAARLLGRSPLDATSERWFRGAVGVQDVAASLERLGPGWCVLHNLPLGTAAAVVTDTDTDNDTDARVDRIDHVVIGPPGVFTVTTRYHGRQSIQVVRRNVAVDGHSVQYIRQAEVGLGHIERILSSAAGVTVAVSAIIAVIDPSSLSIRHTPRDVFVVNARVLASWFERRDRRLGPDEVERLARIAASGNIWPNQADAPTADDSTGTAAECAAFESIRREVDRARMIRYLWAVVVAAAVVGATIAVMVVTLAVQN